MIDPSGAPVGMPDERVEGRADRRASDRVVAGVAGGLADHLRLPVALVRVVFVLLAVAGGVGLVLYAVFWAVLPLRPVVSTGAPPADDETATTRVLAVAAIALGAALLLWGATGFTFAGDNALGVIVPVLLAAVGAALVWQQADADQRAAWSRGAARAARQTAATTGRAGAWRIAIGCALVAFGVVGIVVGRSGPTAALQSLVTALLLVGGLAVVAFPWIHRRVREQTEQRRALIRAEERAEVAAHVHDSVLQTLTLIQRSASDPREVARLARAEERALRSWLYAPAGDASFAARLRGDAADVERDYAADIDVVCVGDVQLGTDVAPDLNAILAAAREAMINAARHGGGHAAVYAEVDDGYVEVFVRDRGPGFDPAAVAADRHGLRESVVGRMERVGGTATVTTSPGSGTEVRLHVARSPHAS